jgi:ubiquinone/menaquinone biosynthesis C-methylase UbiE
MSEKYHRSELEIALNPGHLAHLLPPVLPYSAKVLDIGCGAGQTLIAAYADRVTFGLDIDVDALRLGLSLTDRICFVCGSAEYLPWKSEQFDMVIARVSLPYTNINRSLREIRRVLRKGGKLWMTLHSLAIAWRQAKSSNYKGYIFFAYVMANSILFHYTQRMVPFFGKYNSFQTESGITSALTKLGFHSVTISRGKFFLVTARSG